MARRTNGNGYVKVFGYDENVNNWVQLGPTVTGLQTNVGFGASISLSSNGATLAVGDPLYKDQQGSAEVLRFENTWRTIGFLERTGSFGSAVALSETGDTLIVGGPRFESSGAAFVYRNNI